MSDHFSLRQITTRQWLGVLLLFVIVTFGALMLDRQLGFYAINSDQYYHWSWLRLRHNPDLYPLDQVLKAVSFNNGSVWVYPLFYWLMTWPSANMLFLDAFAFLQPLQSLVYLVGAFCLLYSFCGRIGISALVAVLSATAVMIFPSDQWGVLSAGQVMPSTFFQALSPLLFLGWLRSSGDSKKQYGVFLALGVLGMLLHPVSWTMVLSAMLFAQLAAGKFSFASIKQALLCAAISTLPMLPFIFSFFGGHQPPPLSQEENLQVLAAIRTIFPPVNPAVLGLWWQGVVQALGWVVLAVWAGYSVRNKVPRLAYGFAVGCFLIIAVYYAVNGFLLPALGKPPILVDAFRCLKFLMLPVILVTAIWLSRFQGQSFYWRAAVAVFLVLVMNAKALQPNVPGLLQSIDSCARVSDWFRNNTPADKTLVHHGFKDLRLGYMIRAVGARSIVMSQGDGGLLYYYSKPQFLKWYALNSWLNATRKIHGDCSMMEVGFAKSMGATHFVCPSALTVNSFKLPVVYRDPYLSVYKL